LLPSGGKEKGISCAGWSTTGKKNLAEGGTAPGRKTWRGNLGWCWGEGGKGRKIERPGGGEAEKGHTLSITRKDGGKFGEMDRVKRCGGGRRFAIG